MFILVLLSVLTLAGCGQSGVLYLPEHQPNPDINTSEAKNQSAQPNNLKDVEPIHDKEQ
ncbi:hypothetical protein PCIT_a4425 [Pseudoalteromonas citrea]|uniref:Lipoprotein n=2 Tax=Pseudoalteromonas citrea TaxID=43655 RepID=A0AAD4FQN7_9GAMM|nr:hypothetical protein PCIT_a4425 [Pseudoalteromonas citrea]